MLFVDSFCGVVLVDVVVESLLVFLGEIEAGMDDVELESWAFCKL